MTSPTLTAYPVSRPLRLALLWACIMALFIYADYFALMTPYKIPAILEQKTPMGPTTPQILVIFSVVLIIPALMIPASALLRSVLSKWLNIVFGTLYAAISVLIIVQNIGASWQYFFVLYQFVELFVFFLIVRTALTWPKN
mgnify:CR=1 FL=1